MKSKTIDTLAAQITPEQAQLEIKAYHRLIMMGVVMLMAGVVLQVLLKVKVVTLLGAIVLGIGIYYYDLYRIVARRQAETKKPT